MFVIFHQMKGDNTSIYSVYIYHNIIPKERTSRLPPLYANCPTQIGLSVNYQPTLRL